MLHHSRFPQLVPIRGPALHGKFQSAFVDTNHRLLRDHVIGFRLPRIYEATGNRKVGLRCRRFLSGEHDVHPNSWKETVAELFRCNGEKRGRIKKSLIHAFHFINGDEFHNARRSVLYSGSNSKFTSQERIELIRRTDKNYERHCIENPSTR